MMVIYTGRWQMLFPATKNASKHNRLVVSGGKE